MVMVRELMVDIDEGGEDGGERPPDPSFEGKILDESVSKNEDHGGGDALFHESSCPFRPATFSYI